MGTLLVRHARKLVTMDARRRELDDGALFIRDNVIEQVGTTAELPHEAERVIEAGEMIVMPGLVNTHHHLFQSLTRALPRCQDAKLFDWLTTLYPIWARLGPEAIYTSAKLALCELLLSGCTTVADHPLPLPPTAPGWMTRSAPRASLGRALSSLPWQHVARALAWRVTAR